MAAHSRTQNHRCTNTGLAHDSSDTWQPPSSPQHQTMAANCSHQQSAAKRAKTCLEREWAAAAGRRFPASFLVRPGVGAIHALCRPSCVGGAHTHSLSAPSHRAAKMRALLSSVVTMLQMALQSCPSPLLCDSHGTRHSAVVLGLHHDSLRAMLPHA